MDTKNKIYIPDIDENTNDNIKHNNVKTKMKIIRDDGTLTLKISKKYKLKIKYNYCLFYSETDDMYPWYDEYTEDYKLIKNDFKFIADGVPLVYEIPEYLLKESDKDGYITIRIGIPEYGDILYIEIVDIKKIV